MNSSISASDPQRLRAGLTSGARRALMAIGLGAVLTPLVYMLLVIAQIGSWQGAEWWLRDIIALRRIFYAEEIRDLPKDARKNLVVAGSASLFGVDGGAIEKATGETTLNLGLHAGLDLDLLFAQADRFVDANDRVVVPLEFELYPRAEPTDLTPATFLAFLYPDARAIPPSHLPTILLATSPVRVLEGVVDRVVELVTGRRKVPLLGDDALLAGWKKARAAGPDAPSQPYGYSTMNAHGDKDLLRNTPPDAEADVLAVVTPVSSEISPFTARTLVDWQARFAERGASLALTWPIILEDDKGTIFEPRYWARLIALARDAEAKGLPIHCDPIQAIVPVQYRFDTNYHVNAKGAAIYSAGLAACLPTIDQRAFDWRKADPDALAAAARARIAALKSPSDPLVFGYERNIRLLQGLDAAIKAEHAATGRYPAELPPFDPAVAVAEPGAKPFLPWYRSDGTDYKLVAESDDACFAVKEGWPGLIDPARTSDKGCAYGYWSAGAARW